MSNPDPFSDQLDRLSCIQRTQVRAFVAAFLFIAIGFGLVFFQLTVASYLVEIGWVLLGLVMLHILVVLPFLKCPRCGNCFFKGNGLLGVLSQVNLTNRRCVHCGLSADQERRDLRS